MVEGLVEYVQFTMNSAILTLKLFISMPRYVIVSWLILCFLIVIGLLGLLFYYIYRKFKSIDNHTNKKYDNKNRNENDPPKTYKEDRKEYQKDVSELEARIMPDGQNIIKIVDKLNELKKKK